MLDSETRRRIDTARDILVGKVPDPKSQVEQITIALIYKFMDDMDAESEEMGGKRSFFAGEHEKYGWSKLMAPNMGGYDVINLYSEAIQRFDFNPGIPQLFRDIFKNAYLPYRDPETLKSFLKVINDFEYDHSEKLGDAFEYLLSILGSQGEAGQFRTPRHIIDFMVEVIDPKKNDVIIDPACGTAGFLISSYKHIVKQNSSNYDPEKDTLIADAKDISELIPGSNGRYKGDKLTPDERARLANNIKGYDISPDMVRLSLVNMYLHGFTAPHIHEYDTLTSEDRWNEFGDVIMANPPFMSPKGGIKPHKRFSVQSNRSEVLFVDYIAEHLTPNGRAAVIVPEGIIFQSGNAYKALRKMLVENYLFCVVSLPSGVFNPYSGVKTSILLMDKTLVKKTDKILFVKIENDGFDLGAQRRRIQGSDLPEALNHIKTYIQSVRTGQEFNTAGTINLLLVTKEQLSENGDYNLSMERYKTEERRQTKWPMVELGEVAEYINGFPFKPDDWCVSGIPIIRIQNLTNSTDNINRTNKKDVPYKYRVVSGDLLISWSATIGFFIWKGEEAYLNQHIFKVVTKPVINKLYLFYLGNKITEDIKSKVHGNTMTHITKELFNSIQIPLPPLNIQQEIVAEIESYQKITDGARQVVENYKPTIFIKPEWNAIDLKELVEIRTGKLDVNKAVINGKYPFFTCSKELYYINDFAFDCEALLLAGNNATGDFDVKYCHGKFNAYQRTYVITILNNKANIVIYPYLRYILENNLDLLKRNSIGSQTRYLTIGMIQQLKIPLPPIEIQKRIAVQFEKEQQLVDANKELIQIYEHKIKDKIASIWET